MGLRFGDVENGGDTRQPFPLSIHVILFAIFSHRFGTEVRKLLQFRRHRSQTLFLTDGRMKREQRREKFLRGHAHYEPIADLSSLTTSDRWKARCPNPNQAKNVEMFAAKLQESSAAVK